MNGYKTMRSMNIWGTMLISLMLCLPAAAISVGPAQTGGPTLALSPSQATVEVGETFGVDLVIGGFAVAGVAGMSGFAIDVAWLPTQVSLDSYTLSTALGDLDLGQSIDTSAGQTQPWQVELGQTSLLPASFLSTQLPDTLVLATFEFTALAPVSGCSCIVIGVLPALFDGNGASFVADVVNEGVQITIVPLPAAAWLMVAGLAVLPWRRRGGR